jgi:hypothetical protein
LILTSDHTVRSFWIQTLMLSPSIRQAVDERKEPTIPFLVKLPGQNVGLEFDEPFNAVLLHGILRALLHGQLRTAAEIAQHVRANKGRFPLVVPGEAGRALPPANER